MILKKSRVLPLDVGCKSRLTDIKKKGPLLKWCRAGFYEPSGSAQCKLTPYYNTPSPVNPLLCVSLSSMSLGTIHFTSCTRIEELNMHGKNVSGLKGLLLQFYLTL